MHSAKMAGNPTNFRLSSMSNSEELDSSAQVRVDIVDELWAIVADAGSPAAAKVAALDRLARIEGAYKPVPKPNNNRYKSLADFYADVNPPAEKPTDDEGDV
ncbi:hypothetical protein D3C81_365210 [compost metagenome]